MLFNSRNLDNFYSKPTFRESNSGGGNEVGKESVLI